MAKKYVRPTYVHKEARKRAQKKPMTRDQWIKIGIAAGIVVVLVIVGAIVFNSIGKAGTLPVKGGVIVDKGDNWLVVDTGTSSSHKYYKAGTVDPLPGYTHDPAYTVGSDANTEGYQFVPDAEDAPISFYYVTAVNSKAQEMLDTVKGYYAAMYSEEAILDSGILSIAGMDAPYMILVSDVNEEPLQQIVCYLPSVRDTSILINTMVKLNDGKAELSLEELKAWPALITTNVTVEKE